ncbi:MAG: hypothetical protein U9N79_00815 [Actinomycetota bacterium]|nr:hypothetical protein [Actinomycetota bacterium]
MTSPPPSAVMESASEPSEAVGTGAVPTWLIIVLIGAPTVLILLIMSGVLGVIGSGSLIRFPQILVANTPTGGDMGAHVLLPQVLKDVLLPSGRLFGWSSTWYAGFPALYFYFPIPALITVLLDVFLPYGVAFKLVTIVGLVALPVATYAFLRLLAFSRPVAALAALTGSMFVFMESFSIFGANIKSTLAGEFSFSWSFALSIIYLGIVARDTRLGRRFTPWAGIVLALTAMTHIVTTMIVVVVAASLLFRRNGPRTVISSWIVGFAISAFWALPLGIRVLQGMTTDMGWAPVGNIVGDTTPGSPLPGEFIPVLVLGLVGMVWTMLRRDDVTVLVWLTLLPLAGYFILPKIGITALYNARLLPYWYFGMYVFAGIALGLAVLEISRRVPLRRSVLVGASIGAGFVVLAASILSIHDVPGWVKWNFEGYEGKTDYHEYRTLMETVDTLPPGRIMWEANSDMNKYGTPMALMLFPYWSEGHPSMEGLFFESSLTTPFHFLNASEVSERPSNPVRGLDYRGFDMERGIAHLAVYDVAYYVSFTEKGESEARLAGLIEVGSASPWTIFALPDSDLVDIATLRPAVWDGGGDFLDPSLEWYDDADHLNNWLVETGPEEWLRVESVDDRLVSVKTYAGTGVVTDIVEEDGRISFTTTAVGVPHLVKVSYFPNWTVEGADGPYRAAPSLMVVVPTSEDVVLEFRNTSAENLGMVLTLTALAGLAAYAYRRHKLQPRKVDA